MPYPRIFITGSPHAGTHWIGRLFDAHPWVLFRHEPDVVLPLDGIPELVEPAQYPGLVDQAGGHLDALYRVATVQTCADGTHSAKDYRNPFAAALRRLVLSASAAGRRIGPLETVMQHLPIPDLIPRRLRDEVHEVCTAVAAHGRVGLYAHARPEVRFVLVLRHPAGVIATELRDRGLGRPPHTVPLEALAATPAAMERGLTQTYFQDADDLEKLAWWWVLSNERVLLDTQDAANCLLVNYDELRTDPEQGGLREMFEHTDVAVCDEVLAFLARGTADRRGDPGTHAVDDPLAAPNAWREALSRKQLARIRSITEDSIPGSRFEF